MTDRSAKLEYTGMDNLEVMMEAVNYNRFLVDCVITYGGETARTLDLGAGLGTFSQMVRETGRGLDCLEPDPSLAESLIRSGFKTFRALEEIESDYYDYIYSLNVFEHIENDLAAARQAFRVLRPGGIIFVYVPAFELLFGSMDRKVQHFRRYTRSSLATLLTEAGFTLLHEQYVDFLGFFASVVYNLLSKGDGSINTRAVRVYDSYVFPVSRGIDRFTSRFIGKNVLAVARK